MRETLEEVGHVVHQLLQKKREIDPDPVEQTPPAAVVVTESVPVLQPASIVPAASFVSDEFLEFTPKRLFAEPADQHEAINAIAAAAGVLRRRDAYNPAPYLLLRGLQWGELRRSHDPASLEAPPSELRREIKRLAINNRWRELLELAETTMALPCSRAWLDLQRFVIEACTALGDDYRNIAIAIRSEIRALLRDLPQLMDVTLNDDTPVANTETQAWLRGLLSEPVGPPLPESAHWASTAEYSQAPGWQKKYLDPHVLALEALQTGQPLVAVQILQREIERQPSGRGRFQRKLQLARVYLTAGKDAVAQPLLDDIASEIDTHKLDDWEERELVAGALALLMRSSKRVQGDAKARQTIFERICRLDPIQAISV
jgi:type VI secretion system protein ImpA